MERLRLLALALGLCAAVAGNAAAAPETSAAGAAHLFPALAATSNVLSRDLTDASILQVGG